MRKLLLVASLLLSLQSVFSQAGQLDPSYGNGGVTAPLPDDLSFGDMAIQPDGKIVAIGQIYNDSEGSKGYIVRFTTTGQLDKTFSGDGILSDPFLKADLFSSGSITVQKDGKILAAGTNFGLARYNPDGTPDNTFGNGGYVSTDPVPGSDGYDQAVTVVVTKDGKILLSGNHYNDEGEPPHASLVTYLPNGTVESIQVFYAGMNRYEAYPTLAAYKSGGYALLAHGDGNRPYLYSSKYGQADVPLPNGYGFIPSKLTILENEKIALAVFHRDENDKEGAYVALLNTDGTLDKSFSGDGVIEFTHSALAVASQKDGKLIVSSADENGVAKLERYNTAGTLDFTFTPVDYGFDIIVYGNRIYVLTSQGVAAYQLDNNARTVKVNLYGNTNPYNSSEWNNWNNLRNLNFNNFYYSDSTTSGISAVMSNRNGVNDNGASYGSGMAPAGVLRHSSYSIGSRTVTLSGLTTGKKYSIELYGSRNAYADNSTVYSINGVSKTIATYRNFDNKAVFTNLSPNAQGKIVVTISSTKTYNYLNGFIITEGAGAEAQTAENRMTSAAQHEDLKNFGLELKAFPNPAQQSFTIQLKSSVDAPVRLRVVDAAGRVIETRNMASNTSFSVGQNYKPGVYYVETVQDGRRKLLKLVKASE